MDDDDCSYSDYSGHCSESESLQSTPEEERIRRLFLACDTDGDGFITSVCHQHSLDFSAQEIMFQLGASDEAGKISYEDFVRRRRELAEDLKTESCLTRSSTDDDFWSNRLDSATKSTTFGEPKFASLSGSNAVSEDEGLNGRQWLSSHSAHGSDSVAASSSAKHASSIWEHSLDSGTHDLDPSELMSIHRMIESQGVPVPPNCIELLEIANSIHQSAVSTLKQDVFQVNSRLQLVLKERDLLQKQIDSVKKEALLAKEFERKRSREMQKYEIQVTELNSIIAELSLKLQSERFEKRANSSNCNEEQNNLSGDSDSTMDDSALENCRREGLANELSKLNAITSDNDLLRSELKRRDDEINKLKELLKDMEKSRQDFEVKTTSEEAKEIDEVLTKCVRLVNEETDRESAADCISLEIERLKYKLLHLRSQLDLAGVHLEESKENSEKLTVLLGKYESNNTALDMTTSYYARLTEGYKVANKLLETEMGLLLASCRAAGLGKILGSTEDEDQSEIFYMLERAKEKRQLCETMSLEYMKENKLAHMSKCSLQKEDEDRLYKFLSDCQRQVAFVKQSVVEVESIHEESDNDVVDSTELAVVTREKHDLENVVLMQELMSLKEEKAEMKAQAFVLGKEKAALELQINSTHEIQRSLIHEIERLRNELAEVKGAAPSDGSGDSKLKAQIKELMVSLELVAMNYERHVEEYTQALTALKKENGNLRFKIEKLRKKQELGLKSLKVQQQARDGSSKIKSTEQVSRSGKETDI